MDLLPAVLDRLRRALDLLELPPQAEDAPRAVIVGVSGGPDSLALLHLLQRAGEALALAPHAFHLNHGIRGTEADADAEFVTALATEWGLPCRVETADVPEIASATGLSLEEAARQARYEALARYAVEVGTPLIAVGHNADDQAETVLMHLLRGAGLAGLHGMLPVTPLSEYHTAHPLDFKGLEPVILRPLLGIPRDEIEAYCAENALQPRHDETNDDTTYFRNHLRHVVLPLLAALNPNIKQTLARTADVLAADYDVLQRQVDVMWELLTRQYPGTDAVRFEIGHWRSLPLSIQRETIRRAVAVMRPDQRNLSFEHVDQAVWVAQNGETGAQATLPGNLALHVGYETLAIAPPGYSPPAPDWPFIGPGDVLEIPGAGEVTLPGGLWRFSLSTYEGPRTGPEWEDLLATRWQTALSADALALPLVIRTRRPGDRFHPSGLGGSQKISTVMINEKIPAAWRDNMPLVTSNGDIVWLPGWRVDDRFTVHEETGAIWLAAFERVG